MTIKELARHCETTPEELVVKFKLTDPVDRELAKEIALEFDTHLCNEDFD